MDKKTLLLKRLTSYSATAAAMTALATNASGQTYSGLKNILVDNATVNIDLDNDGTNDFSFENRLFEYSGLSYHYNQISSHDVTNNKWIGSPMVSAFGPNISFPYYTPGSTTTNDWDTNLGSSYYSAGNFAGQGDKYIAVKFSASTKLGWIRINIPTGHATLTIRDWAYTEGGASHFFTGILKPVISNSSVSDATATTAKLNLTSNAEGTAYFVVQLATAVTMPTADEIKTGTGFITAGSGAATADVALSLDMTGLIENTEYKIFYIVENPLVSGNISEVGELSFTTLDVTAPVLSAVSVDGISGNGATAHLTSGENGTAYFAVLAASATAPAATEIKTGTGFVFAGNKTATASTAVEFGLTGLNSETDYKVYMVAEDASGNISEVSSASFTTLDITVPVLSSVTVNGTTVTGATAHLIVDEAGTAYFAVLAASAAAPVATEIKTGTGFAASGNAAVTAATQVDLNITGLSENSAYSFYTVVVDASDNISAISKVDFSTIINSVNGFTPDETVNLFPNPAHGSVQISLTGSALYKIVGISGTVVKSGKLEEGQSTLDINNIPNGNYYILITLNGTTITKKLIVE